MNSFTVFFAVTICAAAALPVSEDFQESGISREAFEEEPLITDEFIRQRRSLEETEMEAVQLYHDELVRERRSLPEADFEGVPLEATVEHGARWKRATCDALSFQSQWITVNHSACAIHCIVRGYKGGKCVDTVCNCRR